MPKITIILSTLNRINSVLIAISSVQNQTLTNYEFIIVDDGSTDGTYEILYEVAILDKRIKLFYNSVNMGLQKSLNFALAIAKGDYIARIDDDDEWIDRNKLKNQYNFLCRNPDYLLIGTAFTYDSVNFINPTSDEQIRKNILFRCPFHHSSVLFVRRHSSINVSYNEQLLYAEDWELWLRIGLVGKMTNLSDVSVKVSLGKNLSEANFLTQFENNYKFIKKYSKFYPYRYLAILYHHIIVSFFKIFTLNGIIHNFAKWLFQFTFNKF